MKKSHECFTCSRIHQQLCIATEMAPTTVATGRVGPGTNPYWFFGAGHIDAELWWLWHSGRERGHKAKRPNSTTKMDKKYKTIETVMLNLTCDVSKW